MNKILNKLNGEVHFIVLTGLVLLFTLSVVQGQTLSVDELVPGKIRIKLKEEAVNISSQRISLQSDNKLVLGIEEIDGVSQEIGITSIQRVFPFSVKNEARHKKYGLHLWYELKFDQSLDPMVVVGAYKNLSDLEIVKPVYKKVDLEGTKSPTVFKKTSSNANPEADSLEFNDPLLPDQWHYFNDGRFGEERFDIGLLNAWQSNTGNSDIIVAVIDQGIDVYHEDLASNIWENLSEINGVEGVDDDGNGYVDDFNGWNFVLGGAIVAGSHGTHVAGTLGAVSNNGIGVAGVAGGDGSGNGVKLMSCQVFDSRVSGGQNFAEAIVYGADNGAIISQNSWGYNQENYYEPEIVDAIDYFINEAGQYPGSPMKGGILFFASGNTGSSVTRYPGAFDNVIGVTSIGPTGFPSPFTTYGEWTDIAAPGGDMTNFGEEGGVLSTLPGNAYGYMEGTSMACPHVSGVAALIVSKFGGSDFTSQDLRRIILNSTSRFIFEHDGVYGKGYLNADRALIDDSRVPPNSIDDLAAKEVFHNEVRLQWTVPVDPDGLDPAYFYMALSESPITDKSFDNEMIFQIDNDLASGETYELQITGFLKNKNYWFAIKSADQFDNISAISNVLNVVTANEPHFMESTRTIDLTIDVQDNPISKVPLTFSNIGEGIVYWASSVTNEKYYFGPLSKDYNATVALNYEEEAAVDASEVPLASPYQNITSETFGTNSIVPWGEHWDGDVTEFISGLTYDNGTNPVIMAGSGKSDAGFILAARFDVPRDYEFNLTHLEAVLYPETNKKPIIIEIKKGGRNNFYESETVYLQEYYPDTVNQFKYYRIPIYRPQKFKDGETFWAVFHFPKEMANPIAMQMANDLNLERLLMSRDNGRIYEPLYNLTLSFPTTPMLSALSTGDDGAYVFIDPTQGEIPQSALQNVETTIDATNLSNGNHLASLGIFTNDVNKPMVNIEVKVNVVGQNPEIEEKGKQIFDVFANRENKLELTLTNVGLGKLEIYDLSSNDPGVIKNFNNTLTIDVDESGTIPFIYQDDTVGIINTLLLLQTNIGEVGILVQLKSLEEPQADVKLSTNDIYVDYGGTATVDLTIKNIGTGASLSYDLSRYSPVMANAGALSQDIIYSIMSSDEPGGPAANQWDDISSYGQKYESSDIIPLEMKFPFFEQLLESMSFFIFPELTAFNIGYITPLKIVGTGIRAKNLTYHSYGDRAVFTFENDVMSYSTATGYIAVAEVEFQIVLFRDGAMEFRYLDVDFLNGRTDYDVNVRGGYTKDLLIYRTREDTDKLLHNGLVIRFEPIEGVAIVKEASRSSGTINAGDSAIIQLKVDPELFGRWAGTYQNNILIGTNTYQGMDTIPVTIHVSGTPSVTVEDSLKLSAKFGQTRRGYIRIVNTGTAKMELTSIGVNLPEFSIAELTPIQINANSHYMVPIDFVPSAIGRFTGTVTLSFEDGSTKDVIIDGWADPDASFLHTIPSDLAFNLTGGTVESTSFTIQNLSPDVDLEYTFINSTFASVDSDPSGIGNSNGNYFGHEYTWKASDSLQVFHKWNDITEVAELLPTKEKKIHVVTLPFSFPFYGRYYDTIWVSNNGYVTVVEPEANLIQPSFKPDDGVRGIIAPFWSDIAPNTPGGGVLMKLESDRVYLQWDQFVGGNTSLSLGSITFQLEIVEDGTILFNYKDVESWGGDLRYGIESPDELEKLEDSHGIIVAWTMFNDNSTIAIVPPLVRKLEKNTTQSFTLKASAKNIYLPGVYSDTLLLRTNSQAQPLKKIPVELTVTGSPILLLKDSLIWEEEVVFRDGLIIKQKLQILNGGYNVLSINNISSNGISALDIYDQFGNKLIKNGSGDLLNPIQLSPWTKAIYEIRIPVAQKNDVVGSLSLKGNFNTKTIDLYAHIVDSPVFSWNATDQDIHINNTDTATYTFTIENQGVSNLKYQLVPAVIPAGSDTGEVSIVDEIGHYEFEQPTTVDSVALDFKENADGVFEPWIGGIDLAFANKFVAPEGGLFLTHMKIYTYLDAIDEYIGLRIYYGGDLPQEGQLVYEQKYVIDQEVDQQWIYMPLEKPFLIPEGQEFFVAISLPQTYSLKFLGFDVTNDENILKDCFSGVYSTDGQYNWYPGYTQGLLTIWKIRPLTAAGKGQWIGLDQLEGELAPGQKSYINTTMDPRALSEGTYEAKVLVNTNDINHSNDEFLVTMTVNGAAVFKYYPNMYQDTLKVIETENATYNYLVSDPENEAITLEMEPVASGPKAEFEQISPTTAQLRLRTGYDDAGLYKYRVVMTDEAGNMVVDTVLVEVVDKNRPPVLNEEYAVMYFNIADSMGSITIDPNDLFDDPDGDKLQIYAGNYTPDIIDMAFGNVYISLIPFSEGTAQLVFAADDSREDGFVAYLIYVIIIDDPDAVQSSTSNYGDELTDTDLISLYPNPVENQMATLAYTLNEPTDVTIRLMDLQGRVLLNINKRNQPEGTYRETLDLSNIPQGLFTCSLSINGGQEKTFRVLIK